MASNNQVTPYRTQQKKFAPVPTAEEVQMTSNHVPDALTLPTMLAANYPRPGLVVSIVK